MGTGYSISDLRRDFPGEEACLAFLFDARHSRKCSCGGRYSPVRGRRKLQCSKCRFQVAPMAGTVFHKSSTPLSLWFHAIFVFSHAKSGVSAKEMQRQLGVTYKCAWRMMRLVREALGSERGLLSGTVETDSASIGRLTVMAAVERGGRATAQVAEGTGKQSIDRFLASSVSRDARLMTDGAPAYWNSGYPRRERITHSYGFSRGDVHVNTAEAFFSHVKRSMRGTFKGVSSQHLQSYLDAFSFHWSNRRSDRERFEALMGILLRA